jgi:hypothetical protein
MRFAPSPHAVSTAARATVAAGLIIAVCAAPAGAQAGNGLYEPFPGPAVRSRAEAYLEESLGRAPRPRDLEDGRFLAGLPVSATSAGQAARRSGERDGSEGLLTWPGALALLFVGALAGAVGRGRIGWSRRGIAAAGP